MHLASVAKQTTEVKPPMFNLSRDLEWDIKSMRNFWLSAALTLGNERVKDRLYSQSSSQETLQHILFN